MAPRRPAGFKMTVRAPEMRIVNEKGQYDSELQRQLYAKNREIAIDLQGQVALRIAGRIQRKSVSSGRLLRVTVDPDNRYSDRYFVGVGNEDFLNRSIAKYWRTMEEGTAVTWTKRSFTSLPLQGLWGTNISRWERRFTDSPWIALGGKRTRAAPTQPGNKGQEMYHPFRYGPGANLPVFHPKADTEPMHAYRDAGRDPDLRRANVEVAIRFFNRVFARGIRPGGYFDA